MCFSAEIDANIKQIAKRFNAQIDFQAFQRLNFLMALERGPDGAEKIKQIFNLKRKSKQFIHGIGKDNRIYPNYFAPVIVMIDGTRIMHPMRYRVRPSGSMEEIPSKYNVFNARIDALENRKTWKSLFGVRHGIFPFKSFYEWVEDAQGKKKLINFAPKDKAIMWAPCLYDIWTSLDGEISIESFAIITDDPPSEVLSMGHDRCPIFILEKKINAWLNPEGKSKEELYHLLKEKEDVYFQSNFLAA